MPKMTTEQFLSQLGIEVGKPFMCEGIKLTVEDKKNVWESSVITNSDNRGVRFISYLLDKEITPLPKYTLSEDEKAIVRNINIVNNANAKLKRTPSLDTGILCFDGKYPYVLPYAHLFTFIKDEEEVSLDELRKCL